MKHQERVTGRNSTDWPDRPDRRGTTLLKGHALRGEGSAWARDEGSRATCSCGARSEPGISKNAAKRWHAAHKDEIRRTTEENR